MKYFLIIICMAFSNISNGNEPTLQEVRKLYERSAEKESSCVEMIEILKEYTYKNNTTYYGYRACAIALMAKHSFNPISKISYFNEGTKMLEEAVNADKENPELRFLRYTIQTNAPSFLGYNSNIEEDKVYLKKTLPNINDQELKKKISNYLEKTT